MPSMGISRLAELNLIYKIRELMEDYGFDTPDGDYVVTTDFPSFIDENSPIWPTITVGIDATWGRDVELGSKGWPAFAISIDVFAKNNSQRSDITHMLWEGLRENTLPFYDFNSAFPSATGDYDGIYPYNYTADYYIDNLTFNNLDPIDTVVEGEKHHALGDGFLYVPNI